MLNIPFWHFF